MRLFDAKSFKIYGDAFRPSGGKDLKKAIKKGKDVIGRVGSSKAPKGYYQSGTTTQENMRGTPRTFAIYSKLPEPKAPKAAKPKQSAAPKPAPAPAAPSTPPTLPVDNFPAPPAPDTSMADALAAQIAEMQAGFMQSMQQQQSMFQQMQASQSERMEALQQQMMQAQVAQQERPQVAGVQMASGAAGTPMQIARRGVSGAFGRRGMRISSLNV
jgi:hypothetical protein